ncbi:hypothetical protein GGH19_004328 [Coemansia sp. RSA 1807]|nr:hypothetical protein GGH19_004328 [Coemansia sp. RSA 1807]KAJ2726001.1 hypothetical protein H4S00_001957 [Coemansia sp. D1744]
MEGLSTVDAKRELLQVLESERARIPVAGHLDIRSHLSRALLGTTLCVVVLQIINGAYLVSRGTPIQTRGIACLVEATLLVVSLLITRRVVARETRLEARELDGRLREVARELRGWRGGYADLRLGPQPTVTTYTVRRDGAWRDMPTLLVANGDVVRLVAGDVAPCAMTECATGAELLQGQQLKIDSPVLCWARETPLQAHVAQIAQHHRRTGRSVLQNQMRAVARVISTRVLPFIASASLASNIVIFGVVYKYRHMGVEAILGQTTSSIFPFACALLWPILWVAARTYASANSVVLFDALQRSKTEYEDMADIDEFDVDALPPTKDVRVGIRDVVAHMRWMWTMCDHRNLSRSSNLAETLGAITVICSIDKEGTIAEPVCTPEQIVVPDEQDYAVLDLAEPDLAEPQSGFIADIGWQRFLPVLRPLALACAHDSGVCAMAPNSAHRRARALRGPTATQTACLCRVARGVGFTSSDLANYHVERVAMVTAPKRSASFVATVVRTTDAQSLHVLSDGNVELILGACLDYFDGTRVCALDDRTVAMYYALYLNALQQDLQCLAYAYRPLRLPPNVEWLFDSSSKVPARVELRVDDEDESQDQVVDDEFGSVDLPAHLTQAARLAQLRAKPRVTDTSGDVDYSPDMLTHLATEENLLRDAVTEQIFLGLITFTYEPKTDVCDFIEDLDIAGIRFVYFSASGGRQSKSFADRLGLETDWNTCILLSSADGAQDIGYVEDHDIKARLPRGIHNIREHLRDVDDIPLQVSLFAECTPSATREMIEIFQENGEVVCCMGSALAANTLTFAVCDLAVGVEPIPHFNRAKDVLLDHENDGSMSTPGALVTQYALGAALTCIPCPLFLQHDTSLYTLMQVVSEARWMVGCMQQAGLLLLLACVSLALVNLIAAWCLLPALPGFMAMWVLWIAVPVLSATLLFVPHDESIMSTMPLKNHAHVSDMSRFSVYAVIRMAPVVALTLVVYTSALQSMLPLSPPLHSLSSTFSRLDWLHLTQDQQWALLGAQTYAMVAFVFHAICVSSTMMQRTRTLVEFVPVRNKVWVCGSFACLALTFAFAALLLAFGRVRVDRVPWYTYAVAFAGPLVLLPLQEFCKMHDKKRWTRFQKLAKLEFKTKLGLHSPL